MGRILVDNEQADLAVVRGLQDRFAISCEAGGPAASRFETGMDGRKTDLPAAADYLRVVSAAMARNPAPDAHRAAQAEAASFGIGAGPAAPAQPALAHALAQVYAALRDEAQPASARGGWSVPVTVRTDYGDDFLTRARVARNYIGALGIEEAMYLMAEVDGQGEVLDGQHRYELRFAAGAAPQVDAFWSLTLYRRSDCMLVDNPIDRYSIGDRTRGLCWGSDGSLELRIQAEDPGPGLNWLPAPREPFYLALRLYQPRAPHLDDTFHYPPVRRLPSASEQETR